ncbi:hypothetical protein diail_6136, partial [Diaporthe ilicicola]
VSAFDQHTVVQDDNLLTPVSSAASPPLHQRSKVQSPYHQPHESTPCPQQPTPPNTSTMYPYSDYINGTSQASSPMSVHATVSQAPQGILGPYLHNSPGHEESIPPPPPYFGAYTASSVSVGQEPDGLPSYYLENSMNTGSYGLIRGTNLPDISSGAYTHRPLAPNMLHQPQPGPYRRDPVPISRLSPINFGRPPIVQVKRRPSRKPSARKARLKKEQSSSPPIMPQPFRLASAGRGGEAAAPEDEVELDPKTPAEFRRLWAIRGNCAGNRGHGMWEDIVKKWLGPEKAEALSDDKKTKLKANLQMKVHRGILRYGSWPSRDKAALLRAYRRWEENRYNEISKLFMEELKIEGHAPAYDWKSIHIEAELVKEGLEQKQREPSKARRRRVQVPARHTNRAAAGFDASHTRSSSIQHQQRLPAVFDMTPGFGHYPSQHYGQQQSSYSIGGHRREMSNASTYEMLVEQLGAQPQPLTDEEHEQLMDECLERASFEASPDPGLAVLEHHNNTHSHHEHDDMKMSEDPYPEEHLSRSRPSSSSLPAIHGMIASASMSPDINATQRSTAMARQACGEMLKQQHNQHQYASV